LNTVVQFDRLTVGPTVGNTDLGLGLENSVQNRIRDRVRVEVIFEVRVVTFPVLSFRVLTWNRS